MLLLQLLNERLRFSGVACKRKRECGASKNVPIAFGLERLLGKL